MNPRSPLLSWLTVGLTVAALMTLAPLLAPVVLAIWTAAIVRPLVDRLTLALKGRNTAAAVMVTGLLLVVVSTMAFLIGTVISGSADLWTLITTSEGAPSALKALVSPGGAQSDPLAFLKSPQELFDWIEAHAGQVFGLLGGIAGAAVRLIVDGLLFFFGIWSVLVDGPRAWAWALRHVPLAPAHLRRLADAFLETGRGLLIGIGLTSASQALAATGIYLALGIPRAIALGLLTGVAGSIPIFGTALLWAPIAAGLFLTDHPVKAVVLAALGIAVIAGMDNVLRPIFARYGKLSLPVYVLFLSIFGGIAFWGVFGALLGPLIVRLAVEALTLLREEREAAVPLTVGDAPPI